MEKNEKLKALAAVVEGFGLTAEEAAAYFGKISVHSEETEEVSVESEKAVSGRKPAHRTSDRHLAERTAGL